VFANVSHLHPSLIFLGQVWEPTIRVESCSGLHSGKLQPPLQKLD
jgi:hypothetical protein